MLMTELSKISSAETINPVARDFILYCIERHGKEWPTLYDKMCWVAGHHLFRGMGYEGLRGVGLSFSLSGVEDTCKMVDTVVAQMQSRKSD